VNAARGGIDFERLLTGERPAAPWETLLGQDPDPETFEPRRRMIADAVERVVVGAAVRGRNTFDRGACTDRLERV
jgi:hypothetical protein